jgi:hypothetical protein
MKTKTGKVKLKFGIMLAGGQVCRWQAEVISRLLAEKNVECRLVIAEGGNRWGKRLREVITRIRLNNIGWWGYALYCQVISKAVRRVDLGVKLKGVPTINCRVIKRGKYSEYFSNEDVAEIRSYGLDFILKFGFGIIRGEILEAAKYGVWSFHHGDEQQYRGGPPGFWEIYHWERVTGAILQRLTEKLDAGIVLKKGWLRTRLTYVANRDQMFTAGAVWPAQVCKDITNGEAGYLNDKPAITQAPIYRVPTNLQLIEYVLKHNWRKLQLLGEELMREKRWNIGLIDQPVDSLITNNQQGVRVNWFPDSGEGRYLADPFALVEDGWVWVFGEEFIYSQQRGRIVYTSYQDGGFGPLKTAIEELFHLSYPFVFKDKGDYFMIPESYEKSQILLYRATRFPGEWKRERVLIDGFAGLDNTLLRYQGRWWLFCVNYDEGENSHLYIFFADDLKGKWQPHAQNPVKVDARSARPAGRIFKHRGKLFRPAMDCSEKYGGGVVINQILRLTETGYREREEVKIGRLKDTKFPDGMHTLSAAGRVTVIDGVKENSIFWNARALRYVISKVRRRVGVSKRSAPGDPKFASGFPVRF